MREHRVTLLGKTLFLALKEHLKVIFLTISHATEQ